MSTGQTGVMDWRRGPAATDPRSLLRWWLGPLWSPATWRAAGYLLAGLFAATLWFALTVTVFAVSLPLVLVGLGVPLVVASLGLVGALSTVERHRAGWVTDPIPPRPLASSTGQGRVASMRVRWGDPDRWRQVGFQLLGIFLAVLTLGGAIVAWGLTGANIGGLVTERRAGVVIAQSLFVVALLGAAPRATQALAELHVRVTGWFLGPDRIAALEAELAEEEQRRREIVDAVAAERHRIERNLHDGAQQRLVALGLDLGMAAMKLPDDPEAARELVEAAQEKARTSLGELRMIGRGLHPAILEDRGLDAALSSVIADAPVAIELDVPATLRLSPTVEETAYFVAAEAVTNIVKHSEARTASIRVAHEDNRLTMVVHDDGRGGADPNIGSGLAGMAARVRAADGRFDCSSPAGGPTVLTVELPTTPGGAGD